MQDAVISDADVLIQQHVPNPEVIVAVNVDIKNMTKKVVEHPLGILHHLRYPSVRFPYCVRFAYRHLASEDDLTWTVTIPQQDFWGFFHPTRDFLIHLETSSYPW